MWSALLLSAFACGITSAAPGHRLGQPARAGLADSTCAWTTPQGLTVSVELDATGALSINDSLSGNIWASPSRALPITAAAINQSSSQSSGTFVITNTTMATCDTLAAAPALRCLANGVQAVLPLACAGTTASAVTATLELTAWDTCSSCAAMTALAWAVQLQAPTAGPQSGADGIVWVTRLHVSLDAGAVVRGAGVQYTHPVLNGRTVPIIAQEQGVGRGQQPVSAILDLLSPNSAGNWHTTYSATPDLLLSGGTRPQRARCMWADTTSLAVLDASQAGVATLSLVDTAPRGRFLGRASPAQLLQARAAVLGRPTHFPARALEGVILGADGGEQAVRSALRTIMQAAENDSSLVSGVWIQDWSGVRQFGLPGLPRTGLWWNWEWSTRDYPNWPGMLAEFASQGLRVYTYVNPLLSNVSGVPIGWRHNYFQEAADLGYLVRVPCAAEACTWAGYNGAGLVDLFNPQAAQWFTRIIQENMLTGNVTVSGWMADFGESYPLDGLSAPGTGHNAYPQAWASTVAGAIQGVGSDAMFFMRSSNIASPGAAPCLWLGDQNVAWDEYDGLSSAVVGLASAGLAGNGVAHSDVGGYTTLTVPLLLNVTRSEELLARWAEFGALSPLFRSHPGSEPSANAQAWSSASSTAAFIRAARLYRAALFIRQASLTAAQQQGMPMARALLLAFPESATAWNDSAVHTQYMLGDALLVAPVVVPGAVTRRAWLPGGATWVHVWTQQSTAAPAHADGAWASVPAPLGQPPIWYRSDLPGTAAVGTQFVANLRAEGLLE